MFHAPAMISAKALGAMPAFAVGELGERKALRMLKAAGLVERFVDVREGYIPEHALCTFVSSVGLELGQDNLGLFFAPLLTVADYGAWGRFVLSAPDLGTALKRAQQVMYLHSSVDRVEFVVLGDLVSYCYRFGLRSHHSYPDVAYSAVAAMLSIPRHFLGPNWSPLKVEFNFPAGRQPVMAEETFGCPVSFDGTDLQLLFHKSVLSTPSPSPHAFQTTTRSDIVLERSAPPEDLVRAVCAVVGVQLLERDISLDGVAQALGIGPRSIQRQLSSHGTTFRELVTRTRMDRALNLLILKGNTVAAVSDALGYGEPGNFSRAFTQHYGASPRKYTGHL